MIDRIRARTAELPRLGDIISLVRGLERFDEANPKAITALEQFPGGRAGKRFARFARAADIEAYSADWRDTYVDSDLFSRERKDEFARPKLIFGNMVPRLRVAYDDQGLYLGNSLFTVAFKKDASLTYLTGALNAALSSVLFNAENNLSAGLKTRPLDVRQLARLPVLIPHDKPTRKLQRYVEANVLNLIHARQARAILLSCWSDTTQGPETRFESLAAVLGKTRKGSWVRHLVPSYPVLTRRSRKFRRLHFRGDLTQPLMRIYGEAEDGTETMLAEAEFDGRELMLYVCCSADQGWRRLANPAPVARILDSTPVPVSGDNPRDSTRAVLRRVYALARRKIQREKIPCADLDLARIDHQVDDLRDRIDGEIFRLYDLSWEQAQAVLALANVSSLHCQQVATYFERLTPPAPETASLV